MYEHDIYGWEYDPEEVIPLYREPDDCDCVWTPDVDVLEELSRRYRSWGNADRARDAWEGIAQAIGPRRPGGWYWCGYWRTGYTVVSIDYSFYDGDPASPAWQMTVQWDDGHRTTHFTAWDHGRDSCHRAPARHPGPAPVPPELRSSAPASSRGLWSLLTSWFQPRR
ncbi:hypothetical protein [Actinokineospora cianjurensis]|uniref:hypothetical protein n=1 Tax=Actinokineospora cianjurensis TaxID=585224 RepID=UPI000EABA0E0|nr:hypothetical protein [Actinokineospora cianjurensis]